MPAEAGVLSSAVPLTLAQAARPVPSATGTDPAGANAGGFFTVTLLNLAIDGLGVDLARTLEPM